MDAVALSDLTLNIYSWNVSGGVEDVSNLSSWITFASEMPDVIVIGLQEIIELSATNIIGSAIAGSGLTVERAAQWNDNISLYLEQVAVERSHLSSVNVRGEAKFYSIISSSFMVGLNLTIFCSKYLLTNIQNIQTGSIPRGSKNLLGNKGALCARLAIYDTSICFVCAHFQAHQNNVAGRNDDYVNIISKDVFVDNESVSLPHEASAAKNAKAVDFISLNKELLLLKRELFVKSKNSSQLAPSVSKMNHSHKTKSSYSLLSGNMISNALELSSYLPFNSTLPAARRKSMDDSVGAQPSNSTFSVKDHDVIFWFGDLNYRIEQGPDLPELYNMIENKLYSELCRYDQLTTERMAGNVFHGFLEGSLAFPPTYKYIPNTNNYDKSLEGKLRRPSYCDRILYLLNNEEFLRSSIPLVPPGVLDERLLRIRRRSNQMELYSLEKCGMAAPIAERVRLVDYTDCPNSLSDHKPVRASFVLSVKS